MTGHRAIAAGIAVVLLAAGCSRSANETEIGASTTSGAGGTTTSAPQKDDTALADGGFGDLAKVCQPGDAKGATDVGVTDTEIHLGTVTDKGFNAIPGLNKEMYDTAVAFTAWCNDHGGILGRHLVVDDRDAKLGEYNGRVLESCSADLALVGGGAVFDDGDNGAREQCGLPNLPGYVVTPKARAAKLQVQAVPNPVYKANVGHYRAIAERLDPEGIQSFGIMTGALPTTKTVRDADVEAAQQVGFKVVYSVEYNPGGENDWRPFVEDMKAKGVRVLQFVGEPQFLTDIQKKMDEAGWHPEITIEDTNIYDTKYLEEAGSFAQDTYIRTSFTPFEMADQNKATQDYLDLMKQYNPSGKVAQLGAQGLSAWLLFAKAATECGADLTRTCLLQNAGAIKSWTGGGLHSAGDPSTNTPTDCVALVKVTPSAFQYDKQATDPNKGIFNCDPANLVELHNDYGVPR